MDESETLNRGHNPSTRNISYYKDRSRRTARILFITLFIIIILAVSLAIGIRYRRQLEIQKPETTNPQTTNGDVNRTGIGLALCGGAYPGGVVAGGIMRGFQRQRVIIGGETRPALEAFDYTVGVSGGNFANVLYAFAPNTTADIILDAGPDSVHDPSKITRRDMEEIQRSSMFYRFNISVANYMLMVILSEKSANDAPDKTRIDQQQGQIWNEFIFEMFLKPFGIKDINQPIGKTRDEVKAIPIVTTSVIGPAELYPEYVSEHYLNRRFHQTLPSISNKFGNIAINLLGSQPLLTHPESNAELWEIARLSDFQIPYGAFISPYEFAIPIDEHLGKYNTVRVGRKNVDNLHFIPVSTHPDNVQPNGEGKFPLSKMFGVATNMISLQLHKLSEEQEQYKEMLSTPSDVEIITKHGNKRKVALSDGGYNAINGVAVLVKKKVRKIICNLYNTNDRIMEYRKEGFDEPWIVGYVHLVRYFGVIFQENLPDYKTFLYSQFYTLHVFDLHSNGENQINKFLNAAKSLHKAGEPIIVTLKDLDVVENQFWGIKAGAKVDLTVIVNAGVPRKFAEQVPLDIVTPPIGETDVLDRYGFFTNAKFNTIPNLVHSKGNAVIDVPEINITNKSMDGVPEYALTAENIQMTKLLSSWMIEHAWEELVGDDGEVKFEGFKTIFGNIA